MHLKEGRLQHFSDSEVVVQRNLEAIKVPLSDLRISLSVNIKLETENQIAVTIGIANLQQIKSNQIKSNQLE